jgi:hypothetical protein
MKTEVKSGIAFPGSFRWLREWSVQWKRHIRRLISRVLAGLLRDLVLIRAAL